MYLISIVGVGFRVNMDSEDSSSFSMDFGKVRLSLISADNYFLWSRNLELVLWGKGLWGIVSGTEMCPDEAERKLKFMKRSDVALSTIFLLIHDSYVAPVMDLLYPKEVRDTLSEQYKSVFQYNRDAFSEKYHTIGMKAGERVIQLRARMSEMK